MRLLGNIVWFLCTGLLSFIGWSLAGIILCLTVILIPFGLQCFKIAGFGLFPFGKSISPSSNVSSLIFNIIWILAIGWELAVIHLASAFLLCITIIGIPFALQSIKMAGISLFPFGITIIKEV
ncbi:YccF domain-containing protein [Streptococcus mutans]|uniref:YccF domain-containing protein n=1 Tax=Streptococcus mutans TaxID=1309 RepID=UPI001CFD96F6|nr:YccF domain-containing protein [Streptococcus mutans]MCB4975944.1 YccF domain-containing protein [Streptococcus mutans]MCB4989556.1 YccF domain-containing protein [Streptococcus mutans]MCB5012902.1 YccF domain-containing protein [Streptococcus mutans]MCB5021261.1 YccF domain-containing protein [Streptococcus mutans]